MSRLRAAFSFNESGLRHDFRKDGYRRLIITDARVAEYVGEKVNHIIYPPWTAMGIERDGKIVCGAVFNCFTGYDCHLTLAAERGAITRNS